MSRGRRPSRGRLIAGGAALGTAAVGAGLWVAQHRSVRRSLEAARQEAVNEELELPGDLTHHHVAVDDGTRIHVVERGTGPALVLLHGIMSSSSIWVHQLSDLAARHRVIAVDLRGHGASEAGDGPIGVDTLATDVTRVLEKLDVRDCLLTGHSMGGMVALQVARDLSPTERNVRLAGLAIVSSTAGPTFDAPGGPLAARLVIPGLSQLLLAADRVGIYAKPNQDIRWWATRLGFGPEPNPGQVRFAEQLHHTVEASTFAKLLPATARFDLSDELDDLDVPCLVVVGSHDRLMPVRHSRRLAASLPQAQLVELPRCGHNPMLERRREFSRLLEEFLAKVG